MYNDQIDAARRWADGICPQCNAEDRNVRIQTLFVRNDPVPLTLIWNCTYCGTFKTRREPPFEILERLEPPAKRFQEEASA